MQLLHWRRRLLLCGVAAILGACATVPKPSPPDRPGAANPATVTRSINLSGYPPEFRRGFTDGCTAASALRPAVRPPGEAQYRLGWGDGFDYCKPKARK